MGQLVSPKVYLLGYTAPDYREIRRYLYDTDQVDFLDELNAAQEQDIPAGLALCSMYAKLCYKSLVSGKNANVTRTRGIADNLANCFDVGHLSVFEHCSLNFLASDVSRILTHELVRHRVGAAYSQTSGRYCRLDSIDLVWDEILDPVKELFARHVRDAERVVYMAECRLGLRKPNPAQPNGLPEAWFEALECVVRGVLTGAQAAEFQWVPDDSFNFERRKKITSAIRRIVPNGQANEIGFTLNVRSLRHVVQVRTARHAEREIRDVFAQVYRLTNEKFPGVFHGAKEEVVDGLVEVSGLRQQPYDHLPPADPLKGVSAEELEAEIARRKGVPS